VNLPSPRACLAALAVAAACAAEAAPQSAPAATATAAVEHPPVLVWQVGSGVVAAAVSTPTSLALGWWLSTLTGNDLGALPALLVAAVVPPLVTTLAAWFTGSWAAPGRFGWSPALWITTGVSVASLVAAGFLGFNANEPGEVALYTAASSVLLPATAVGVMHWTAAPPPAPLSLSPSEPRLPKVASVPVVRISF